MGLKVETYADVVARIKAGFVGTPHSGDDVVKACRSEWARIKAMQAEVTPDAKIAALQAEIADIRKAQQEAASAKAAAPAKVGAGMTAHAKGE